MLRIQNKNISSVISKLIVAAVLFSVVIIPIIVMLSNITADDIFSVINSPKFVPALVNSVVYTSVATVIVVVLAYLLAVCMTRVNIQFKRIFNLILILPMLIPSISHGMGLIILFGNNGVITNIFNLNANIYGGLGIVLGSIMYAFPVAYIMLSDVLRYENISVYEAANILGINKFRAFLRISLPFLKKPLLTAAFSTFSMIVTDYGVPLMIGGKTRTLSTLMYDEVIGQLKFGRGAVYGVMLLLPAVIAFVSDLLSKDTRTSSFVKQSTVYSNSSAHKSIAYLFCTLMSIFALLPIVAFALLALMQSYPNNMNITLDNFIYIFKGQGADYLVNSLVIAAVTAFVGSLIGFITAYLTARMRSSASSILHLIAISSMAIPGTVLGISYVLTFVDSIIYGTVIILVMVNTAHFISSPYLMMYNSLNKMNENLEDVGNTLGIGRLRMIFKVVIPQSIGTLAEMFSYLFVNSMMTISAVSFLSNVATKPISLMINQFEEQMQYEYAAVVSLLILFSNIILKIIVDRIKIKTSHE